MALRSSDLLGPKLRLFTFATEREEIVETIRYLLSQAGISFVDENSLSNLEVSTEYDLSGLASTTMTVQFYTSTKF